MEFRERLEEREELVFEELRRLALPHVEASNGLFQLLDHDTERYESQSLGTWHVDGTPQDVGTVEYIAKGIEPRFGAFTEVLEQGESDTQEISRIGEQIKKGQNVIIVTNHGDIKDVAYTLAAYYSALKSRQYKFQSSLVMSKIISFIGVGEHGDPATNILKNVCDTEYFSFPRTKSIEESRIAGTLVDNYNRAVRLAMTHQLHKGGNLFAMAPSGTTDKAYDEIDDSIILGQLSSGTMKLMKTDNSLVLPVAVWLDEQGVFFKPCDIPRAIKSDEEAHQVMSQIAQTLSANITDKHFTYYN